MAKPVMTQATTRWNGKKHLAACCPHVISLSLSLLLFWGCEVPQMQPLAVFGMRSQGFRVRPEPELISPADRLQGKFLIARASES